MSMEAVLNVAMLLRDSEVARADPGHLLDVEALTRLGQQPASCPTPTLSGLRSGSRRWSGCTGQTGRGAGRQSGVSVCRLGDDSRSRTGHRCVSSAAWRFVHPTADSTCTSEDSQSGLLAGTPSAESVIC